MTGVVCVVRAGTPVPAVSSNPTKSVGKSIDNVEHTKRRKKLDYIDQLRILSARIRNTKDMIQTEEATKTSMIMPLIQILGYNVFDPLEVTPEFIADIGTKKGEKVDYAILKEGKPIIIFECKKVDSDLSINNAGQLFRYFHVTAARFAVLTNGITYKFFTDLEEPNKMDEKPFFEFNILEFRDRDVEELKKFAKTAFDVDTILTTASDLKFTRAIKNKLQEWMANPSEEFVKLVSADLLGTKRFTSATKDQFTAITQRAFEQLVSERINERLKGAMTPDVIERTPTPSVLDQPETVDDAKRVVTTEEEIEGFHAVRAIVREIVQPRRVFMRDAQSYCAVLLDDNNRKTLCRLHFNNTQKLKLGIVSSSKEEELFPLESVDDVFKYSDKIKAVLDAYLNPKAQIPEPVPEKHL